MTILRRINATKIAGVLVTHEHGDHAAYAKEWGENYINVYAPFGCDYINISSWNTGPFKVGEFQVIKLPMRHDVHCVGYLIHHKEIDGDILYATDTNGIPYRFNNLAVAMIEADYDNAILQRNVENGIVHKFVAGRTIKTHNSLTQAINFINKQVKTVSNVILLHLSQDNAREELFLSTAKEQTKKDVYIAKAGLRLVVEKYDIFK